MKTVLQAAREIDAAFVNSIPLCAAKVSLRTRIRNGHDTRAINVVMNVIQFAAELKMTLSDYTYAAASALRLQYNSNRLSVLSIGNRDLFDRIQQDGCAALYAVDCASTMTSHMVHTESVLTTFTDSLVNVSEYLSKLDIVITAETIMLLLLGRRASLSEHLLYDHPEINDHWKTVGDSFLPGKSMGVVGQEHFELWRTQKEILVINPAYIWWHTQVCNKQNLFGNYQGGITSGYSRTAAVNAG